MRGFLFSAALLALIPFSAAAAGNDEAGKTADKKEKLDSVVVSASRATSKTPVTYTMVGKEEMRKTNPLNSVPMMLNLQPSVVAVNEGGTGIGPSKMTVRGSKGSQINVTFNGITLNDAVSQEVFWVNIPSLNNILSSVQLQRGLGTTANGAGAFGASVNMGTSSVSIEPYAAFDISGGAFSTFTASAAAGSGLLPGGFYVDAAYSRNYTDGYIRNGKVRSQSAFATLGWLSGSNSLKLTYLMGDQHSGITWNGITLEQYEKDPTYNSTGAFEDKYGNTHYYDNDTDNYTQHHLQLNYTHQFNRNVFWTTTFNFTKGDGYYENWKGGKKFKKYGFRSDFDFDVDGNGEIGEGEHFGRSDKADFLVQKAMDNCYYVLNSEVKWNNDKVNFVGGVNLSSYRGSHFGNLLFVDALGENYDYDGHWWYRNNDIKNELNVFARTEYTPLSWMTAYLDLQYRGVTYKMWGIDDEDDMDMNSFNVWNFFNPRAGISFHWNPYNKAYISAALGNREAARDDLKEVIGTNNTLLAAGKEPNAKIDPEKMVDVEFGYEFRNDKVAASANFYFMEYMDMLLETGKLSDTGRALKENTGRAWRRGIELAAAWQAAPWFKVDGNFTYSVNQIKDYSYYVTTYDDFANWEGESVELKHVGKTTMLMSPSFISMLQLSFTPFRTIANNSLKTTTLAINGKYVGKQYLDNTHTESLTVPGYVVANLSLTHEFDLKHGKLGLGAYVNNFINQKYYADGWVWHVFDKKTGQDFAGDLGIFPQAPANFMLKVSYRF